jgi:hypothetical protein
MLSPHEGESLAPPLAHAGPFDPDLARVMAAWPSLPAGLKAAVLAIVDSAAVTRQE